MFEMKINVEVTATEIVTAINNLADVIGKIGTPVVTPIVTKAEPVNPEPVQQAASVPQQKAITIDMLAAAGAPLVDQGKMQQLMALLNKYGVQAITQLTPDKYDAFAADLRAIGAQI